MGAEQREYPRLEQEFDVFFDVVSDRQSDPASGPLKKGSGKDVSGGGLYLIAPGLFISKIRKLLSLKNKLNVEFNLPDFGHKINALGELRWVKTRPFFNKKNLVDGIHWWNIFTDRWELGIRFVAIKPEDKNSIIKYVINKRIEEQLTKKKS